MNHSPTDRFPQIIQRIAECINHFESVPTIRKKIMMSEGLSEEVFYLYFRAAERMLNYDPVQF